MFEGEPKHLNLNIIQLNIILRSIITTKRVILVATVPPEGVHPVSDTAELSNIANARNAGTKYSGDPNHTLVTTYQYNSLNQLIQQKTPDAGTSLFYYDALGRIIFSKNAQQLISNKYSYTKYDELGRITEVGQLMNSSMMEYNP